MIRVTAVSVVVAALTAIAWAQIPHSATPPLQPLAQQVQQIEKALAYLGQPLSAEEVSRIGQAVTEPDEAKAVARLESVLDAHVLAIVQINAESRVKVEPGRAGPELVEAGTRIFLVKVSNDAGVTAQLKVESPNSGNVYIQSTEAPQPAMELTPQQAANRWADISLYQNPPMPQRLSGLAVDYQILEIYSRDAGQRSAIISFNVGQGTQDIGFRNDITLLFTALPAHAVTLRVHDENGEPAQFVPHNEGRHGWLTVLVVHAQGDRVRRERGKEKGDVIAKADILSSLTDVEADDGRSLAGVATVNFKDLVIDRQARQALGHRRILIERNIGPAVRSLLRSQFHRWLRGFRGLYVHVSRVWTLYLELRGHARIVADFDQKDPGARFDQFRPGTARLNFHAALGVDLNDGQNVSVQNALQASNGFGLVRLGHGLA